VYNFVSKLSNNCISNAALSYQWNVKQKITLDHMVHAVATLEYTENMLGLYGTLIYFIN